MANISIYSSLIACLGALCAALIPAEAKAFKSEQVQPAAASKNEQNGNVIVFDNAYLDKRFGRTRASETGGVREDSSLSANSGKTGNAVSASSGAGFLQIAPKTSLLKGITRGTSARRAAALRLVENGRQAVQNQQYQKAIHNLEKALSVDASPFAHLYLARAYYQLADYQRSLEFLEVAESGLDGHAQWLPELAALRRALSAAPPARDLKARSAGRTRIDQRSW